MCVLFIAVAQYLTECLAPGEHSVSILSERNLRKKVTKQEKAHLFQRSRKAAWQKGSEQRALRDASVTEYILQRGMEKTITGLSMYKLYH